MQRRTRANVARTIAAIVVLAAGLSFLFAVEVGLRLLGAGEQFRRDPRAGFSSLVPSFVESSGGDGDAFMQLYDLASHRNAQWPITQFMKEKPANGFRVFVLGASSAAGVPYTQQESFAGWLLEQLKAELPDFHIEVINAATPGFGTLRLRNRAREIRRYEPDLLIIYSGHAELAERRYYEAIIGMSPTMFRLWEVVSGTRLYAIASSLRDRVMGAGKPDFNRNWVAEMFAASRFRDFPDPGEQEKVARAYRDNVDAMIRYMHDVGARVLLLSVSQDFAGWSPGGSRHRRNLSAVELARWQAHRTRGDDLAAEDCVAALEAWEQALTIDDQYAGLHFAIGDCQRALARYDEARRSFRLASDLDAVPWGAPTSYAQIVRLLSEEHRTMFMNIDEVLSRLAENGIVGHDWFADPMHPHLRAHLAIAAAIAEHLYEKEFPAPKGQWLRGSYHPPSLEDVYAAHPDFKRMEHLIVAMICRAASRKDCVADAAREILRINPDDAKAKELLKFAVAAEQES